MQFPQYEAPVAHGMIAMIDQIHDEPLFPFTKFCCCWMAFNSIYFAVAKRIAMQPLPSGQGPMPFECAEGKQIALACRQLSDALKEALINSTDFDFFADRYPFWNGVEVRVDDAGNRLNGVLNVGYSDIAGKPIVTLIDRTAHARWKINRFMQDRNRLSKQIVSVLYAVRNNTFHGGKQWDDPNSRNVVNHAYPLLRMIVESFLI